jgi:predicted nucleic acid-binding protein
MTYVIDASAMAVVCTTTRVFERLTSQDLVAPALLWPETCTALHKMVYRGLIPRSSGLRALEVLRSAPVRAVDDRDLLAAAFDVADRLGWVKTHDAEYVALAGIEGVPLITLDERLRRGAERLVKVVGPTELG